MIETFKDIGVVLSLDGTDGPLLRSVASLPAVRLRAGRVHLFHVIPTMALSGHVQEMVHALPSPHFGLESELESTLLAEWEQIHPDIGRQGGRVSATVREGHPLQTLLQLCENRSVDLLVMATRPGDPGSGLMAKRLARHTKHALLFLPTGMQRLEMDSPVVPFDFSDHSIRAVRTMIRLLDDSGQGTQSVRVLHIVDYPPTKSYLTRHYGLLTADWEERLAHRFRTDVAKAGINPDRLEFQAVKNDRFDVAGTLREVLQTTKSTFVCLGALGHSSLEHLFLGSVTEALVGDPLDLPVLLVRN